MPRPTKHRSDRRTNSAQAPRVDAPLRIIGGRLRGRRIEYGGDLRTRPMKDRLREAIFNLIGPSVKDSHAVDLFAGTGALGLEAISRGAAQATFIEQHFPTAAIIRRNIAAMGVDACCEIATANTFIWAKQDVHLSTRRWVVFCSPPYAFYRERWQEMHDLLSRLIEIAPAESTVVVEADDHFDFATLPVADSWDVRHYAPALVGIYRKTSTDEPGPA